MRKLIKCFSCCNQKPYSYLFNTDFALLFQRVLLASLLFFAHGLGKLLHFSELSLRFPDPLGVGSALSLSLAVFAEAICPLLILLGLCTRLFSIPVIITMLVAIFMVHGSDPWAKKELAVMYLVGFSSLFFSGSGKYCIHYFLNKLK